MGFGGILAAVLSGFLIGGAARWVVPGPDPMPFWLTVLIGLAGSVVGGAIGIALYGTGGITSTRGHVFVTVMIEILAAAGLVALYRRFVQRRPLAGRGRSVASASRGSRPGSAAPRRAGSSGCRSRPRAVRRSRSRSG